MQKRRGTAEHMPAQINFPIAQRTLPDQFPQCAKEFGLTNDEFRAMTAKQFQEVAVAIQGGVTTAVTIPNAPT